MKIQEFKRGVPEELRNMKIRADLKNRKYINNLITTEYLQQYNNP